MNTLFHVLDEEWQLVATVRFEIEPHLMLGYEPLLGKRVWLGPPFHEENQPYEIVGIEEEYEEKGLACALRLKPKCALHS